MEYDQRLDEDDTVGLIKVHATRFKLSKFEVLYTNFSECGRAILFTTNAKYRNGLTPLTGNIFKTDDFGAPFFMIK